MEAAHSSLLVYLAEFAQRSGLRLFGCVKPEYSGEYQRFARWLGEGKHAEMAYLERYASVRRDPVQILEGAQSVLLFGLPYFDGDAWPRHGERFEGAPRVAQYARFNDYHREFKKRLERLCAQWKKESSDTFDTRVIVDTAPVLERGLAARSGSGFIGKNTCFIRPTEGSFFLLAEVFTTLSLDADSRPPLDSRLRTTEGGCGRCRQCQVKCPTGALNVDYTLDANLCLAYWTIENRGPIPEKFWPYLRYYVFGCDICQLVCPYNGEGKSPRRPNSLKGRFLPSLFEMAVMSQTQYERWFGGTPLTRAKRSGLRRNALIALTVTADVRLKEALARAEQDAESPVAETLKQIEQFLERAAPSDFLGSGSPAVL